MERTVQTCLQKRAIHPPKNGNEWKTLLMKIKATGGPNLSAFALPTTEKEWNKMLKKLAECGVEREKAVEMLKEQRERFINACEKYFS